MFVCFTKLFSFSKLFFKAVKLLRTRDGAIMYHEDTCMPCTISRLILLFVVFAELVAASRSLSQSSSTSTSDTPCHHTLVRHVPPLSAAALGVELLCTSHLRLLKPPHLARKWSLLPADALYDVSYIRIDGSPKK